jgi:biopolymer transport protein ExbD
LHSVNLNLPVGTPPPPSAPPEIVRIDINAAGTVSWNGETVSDTGALQSRLAAAAAQATPPELHVRPDRKVAYKVVAGIMAAVQRNGLHKVGLIGSEQFM